MKPLVEEGYLMVLYTNAALNGTVNICFGDLIRLVDTLMESRVVGKNARCIIQGHQAQRRTPRRRRDQAEAQRSVRRSKIPRLQDEW